MTGNIGRMRAVLAGIAGVAVASGLFVGSAATAFADPDPTAPTTTTTPVPVAAEPAKPTALAPSTAPAPTVAVAGGAAVGAAASAAAATAAAAATQGDVLDQLAEDYAVGSGGGQLSNLLKTALKLRSMGFKPSKPYLDEIKEAMTHRPNQLPLIGALKDTIAYQQKIQAQMQILQSAAAKNANGAVMGAGAAPGAANPANVAPQASAPGMPAAAAPPVILPTTP
ncbi:MAG: hypothetical protein WCP30_03405 [Mycobacteriaceae bacterium]